MLFRFFGRGGEIARLTAGMAAIAGAVALAACSSAPASTDTTQQPASAKNGGSGSSQNGSSSNGGTNGGNGGSAPIVDAPDVQFQIMPFASFSGYDGQHTFKVPVAVYGGGSDLAVTASDPSAVDITKVKLVNPGNDLGRWFFLETKKAGRVMITAASGGQTVTTSVTIKSYDPSSYDAGSTRYMQGSDDGSQPACTQCHDANGGIDHSPATMASSDDIAVQAIITTGVLNEHPITGVVHKWQASDTELTGLVTYLRALEPRGFAPAQ